MTSLQCILTVNDVSYLPSPTLLIGLASLCIHINTLGILIPLLMAQLYDQFGLLDKFLDN